MRISLLFKLMGAFLVLILVSALVISISTLSGTRQAFNQYSSNNRREWSLRLVSDLADFYSTSNSWSGVEQFLTTEINNIAQTTGFPGRGRNDRSDKEHIFQFGNGMDGYNLRVMLADQTGIVLFDSHNEMVGEKIVKEELEAAYPVSVSNDQIGSLLVSSGGIISGSPAANFLESVNHSIVFSVLAGVLIAIIMGALLFNQFTSPLRQLQKAAVEVGKGDFNQRVNIRSRDEFSDVGKSFNQMAESLENAEIARQHYMADIAHELRTPLTAIQGTVEAMQDKILPLDEEQLSILHTQATLLNRLVEDLRLLSLAETGHLKLMRSQVNPTELIRQALDGMKAIATTKSITLQTEIDPAILVWSLDSHRFIQILNNLLGNAIRYTPEDGTIYIRTHLINHNTLELRVIDTGTGIGSDDLPYVFDRFFRADKSRARISGGSGLGLAIVKHLVEAHGGKIFVNSPVFKNEPGQSMGTEFVLRFPSAD